MRLYPYWFTVESALFLTNGTLFCSKQSYIQAFSDSRFSVPKTSDIKPSTSVKSDRSFDLELKSPNNRIFLLSPQNRSISSCISVYGSALAYREPYGGIYTTPQNKSSLFVFGPKIRFDTVNSRTSLLVFCLSTVIKGTNFFLTINAIPPDLYLEILSLLWK